MCSRQKKALYGDTMRTKKDISEVKTLNDDDIKTSRGSRSPLLRAGVMILSSAAMIAVTACGGTGPGNDNPGTDTVTDNSADADGTGDVVDVTDETGEVADVADGANDHTADKG